MSMNYFTPADLKQFDATYNYTARAGLGFALTQDNEQVFINVLDVKRHNLEIGDTIHVWATDNYASPHTAHFPSRWRAVRIEVKSRMMDTVRDTPTLQPSAASEPAKYAPDFVGVFTSLLDAERPWSAQELTQTIARDSVPLSGIPDLLQRVEARLITLHKQGEIAALKVYARGDQQSPSAVYYAKNDGVFYEHLDTPLNADA